MSSLGERIRASIAADGPMPFDVFMEMALYDTYGGFFGSGGLRSAESGDFLTSPEVSPWFGRTIARFVESVAERIGVDGFTVIDIGAGSGSLLRALLDSLSFPVSAIAVERSEAAREALRRADGVEVVGDLPDAPWRGVVVGNEVLDNVPAALVRRTDSGWVELMVSADGGRLALTEVPSRPVVTAWAGRHAASVPPGGLVEVQIGSGDLVATVVDRLEAGAGIFFDYGDSTDGLASRRAEGTLRTYRAHHLGPDPLLEPGSTDITFDVDFTAMAQMAAERGATGIEVLTQRDLLERWGLREELSRLRHRELELARSGEAMARIEIRSEIAGIETILHPRGLGDFRALVFER